MKAAVIASSGRLGGVDLLLKSVALQASERSLVIVDGLHQFRAEAVRAAASALPFPVLHVPPRGNPWPRSAPARYLNTGLAAARDLGADVVLVVPDWTWLRPSALSDHLSAHEDSSFNTVTSGVGALLAPPSLLAGYGEPIPSALSVPGAVGPSAPGGTRRLVEDVYAGRLQDRMMSCLVSELGPSSSPQEAESSASDLLVSYRLDSILSVDGFDERYDGGRPGLLHVEAEARLRDQLGGGYLRLGGPPRAWRAVCPSVPDEETMRPAAANLELLQWSQRFGFPRSIPGVRLLPVG